MIMFKKFDVNVRVYLGVFNVNGTWKFLEQLRMSCGKLTSSLLELWWS